MKKGIKLILLSLITFFGMFPTAVFAYDIKTEDIDEDVELSLTVSVNINDTDIHGTTINIYKIADVEAENYLVTYTPVVGDYDYEGISASDSNTIAEEISEGIDSGIYTLEKISAVTSSAGKAVFNDLEKGMYLVVQEEPFEDSDGNRYYFEPYLVSVPLAEYDAEKDLNVWTYSVVSEPKVTDYVVPESPVPQTV